MTFSLPQPYLGPRALFLALDLGSSQASGGLDRPHRQAAHTSVFGVGEFLSPKTRGQGMERGKESTGRDPETCLHPTPRLAKSTLTLIPLLGTHEVIFAFVMDEHARGMLRFIKLFTELSFTSFQVTSWLGVLTCQVLGWEWAGDHAPCTWPAPCTWASGAWEESGRCPEFCGWSRARARLASGTQAGLLCKRMGPWDKKPLQR